MVVLERLDVRQKENWSVKNAGKLADMYEYKNDREFRKAISEYRKQIVEPSRCTEFLGTLAVGFLRGYQPPLTPLKK